VLGTISLPEDERNTLDSRPSGPHLASGPPPAGHYLAAFHLTITVPEGTSDLGADRLGFTVPRSIVASKERQRPMLRTGDVAFDVTDADVAR